MAEQWKPQPPNVLRHWVDTIEKEASDKLDSWETNFVSQMGDLLDKRIHLTQAQQEKLEDIYAEYTS